MLPVLLAALVIGGIALSASTKSKTPKGLHLKVNTSTVPWIYKLPGTVYLTWNEILTVLQDIQSGTSRYMTVIVTLDPRVSPTDQDYRMLVDALGTMFTHVKVIK